MSYTKEHDLEFDMSNWLPHLPFRSAGFGVNVKGSWGLEDASFDYAGTHCTGGMSGTHYCYEVVLIEVEIQDAACCETGEFISLTDAETKYYETIAKDMMKDNWQESPDASSIREYHEDERAAALCD